MVGNIAVLIVCLLAIWAMAYWLWLLFARGIAMDGNRAAQTATSISRKTQPFKFWVTAIVYGVALFETRAYPKWLAVLAIAGGLPTAVAGVVMAYTGFSDTEMTINMPANIILVVWLFALGVLMWRRSGDPLPHSV